LLEEVARYEFGGSREPLTRAHLWVTEALHSDAARGTVAVQLAGSLESDATLDAKQFICRELARCAGPGQVSQIAALLSDPAMADMARYALQPIPGDAVDQALSEALESSDGAVRVGIINSLGERNAESAIRDLGRIAANEDLEAAEAAIAALGKIGGKKSAKALRGAKRGADATLQRSVADAQLLCADGLRAAGDTRGASRIYSALFDSESPGQVRVAAFLALASMEGVDSRFVEAAKVDADPALAEAIATLSNSE
jgi:HEAT repeat protein